MGLFRQDKPKDGDPTPAVEQAVGGAASDAPVTREVVPASMGKIESTPRGGGAEKKVLMLPESVFLGSEEKQRSSEDYNRGYYGAESPAAAEMIDQELHKVELSQDFPAVSGGIESHREYHYVQTPDGRIHSDRGVLEYVGENYSLKGEKKIVESREITPEGLVTSSRKETLKKDGTRETRLETLGRDSQGNLTVREYRRFVGDEEVYRTETRLLTGPGEEGTVTTVRLSKSPEVGGEVGEEIRSSGRDRVRQFRNQFDTNGMLGFLEK